MFPVCHVCAQQVECFLFTKKEEWSFVFSVEVLGHLQSFINLSSLDKKNKQIKIKKKHPKARRRLKCILPYKLKLI